MTGIGIKQSHLFLLIAILVLIIGVWGSARLYERPGIKAFLEKSEDHLRIIQLPADGQAARSGVISGDILLEIDENPIHSKSDLHFFLDQKRIDQSINLTLQRNGEVIDIIIPLERRNSSLFLLINFLAGLFLWVVGVFVFLRGIRSQVTRIFLFSSLSFSLALFVSWEGFPYGPEGLSFILPSLQIIAYTLIPALFFHFSIVFPREEEISRHRNPFIYALYLPGLVLIILMEIFYWRSISANSLSLFQAYKILFLYFRIYLVAYVLLGIGVLYQTYKNLVFLEDKRKLRWIFWGIVVGTFPFIFLHTLPDVLFSRSLIPEMVNYLFMLLIPISFAFSILRYQVMDIDVVIHRSLVYSLLAGFVVGIYLFVVGLLGEIIHLLTGYQGSLFFILAGVIAALLFTPAKNRIRAFVERTLYRVRYDYRKAVQKFIRQVNLTFTRDELLELLLRKLDVLLAAQRAFIFLKEDESKEFKIAKSLGFSEEEVNKIDVKKMNLLSELSKTKKIQGAKGSTEFREISVLLESQILNEFEIKLSFPIIEKEELFGFLLIGKKKSKVRYSAEDLELISLMVQEVGQTLQTIKMRERVMAEKLEKEKLEELNKLKTKFISNVSHDLRTPLTSIKLSVDNMLQGVCGEVSGESRKHLEMVKESTLHVTQMINNLLTLSMSESSKIVLNKEKLPLNQVVDEACGVMKVLAQKKDIDLFKYKFADTFVYADKHGLLQILLNLLDNSLKFTSSGGKISVSAKKIKEKKMVEISVTDNGIGISPENLEKIFERFRKLTPDGMSAEKGLGIGLDIVRNLVHLHEGEIKVESPAPETGKGTKFSFTLPES
ncbi:MAG: ATP-binding protein [Candidatus Zixiibacteriota bacterium]